MSSEQFTFAGGNLAKLTAIPAYLLGWLLSWFTPRRAQHWAFGSHAGVAEGALALAREVSRTRHSAHIVWLIAPGPHAEAQHSAAEREGFTPVPRDSWQGFWATLRSQYVVVTHGLGDVNRFAIRGSFLVQLWHGAPLKRIHFDAPGTLAVRGPAVLRRVLRRMYRAGAQQVDLYVAGSELAAERLRSAFRVQPGRVQVLGDPRDDVLSRAMRDPELRQKMRAQLLALGEGSGSDLVEEPHVIVYAPTWRDGAPDPGVPNETELAALRALLHDINAVLIVRPHPLAASSYEQIAGGPVQVLTADTVRDVTPLLCAVDVLITDYSSIAVDAALCATPVVWFAPDLAEYERSRGLYEPLSITSAGQVLTSWEAVTARLRQVVQDPATLRRALADSRALTARFHAFPEGGAAARVCAEVVRLSQPARQLVPEHTIFCESFYGRQVSCNPLALDRAIALRYPAAHRVWSVVSSQQQVPEGAYAVLVGGREWDAMRRYARLLIVNDWLRFGFRRRRGQTVLQTWHGTMLKHLALQRPGVSLRTRLAVRRESRRWTYLLSQNPHASEQFRRSYRFRGEIFETGYPRNDALAQAMIGAQKNPIAVASARARLGIASDASVLLYAPTWRDRGVTVVDDIDVAALARELGPEWTVVTRGHTRTHHFGGYRGAEVGVRDASRYPDVNDLLLAADVLVTDYSSLMFDASVAQLPTLFFVPDLEAYRDRERGFTFDFGREAPGPLLRTREDVVAHVRELRQHGEQAEWLQQFQDRRAAWAQRFHPTDDGAAAGRVLDELEQRGVFTGM